MDDWGEMDEAERDRVMKEGDERIDAILAQQGE